MLWLWIILSILLGLFLFFGAASFVFYFYETANDPGWPEQRQKLGMGPAKAIFVGLAQGLYCQALVNSTYLAAYVPGLVFPRWKKGKSGQPRPDAMPPVLCVHGLYHNASAWLLYKRRLKKAGFSRVHGYSYCSFFTNFEKLVDKLGKRVDMLREMYGGKKVLLLGHSLGGLQIRAYMARPESHGKVVGAATLAAPMQGSRLAALGLGGLGRSLMFRQKLVQDLEAGDAPAQVPCLSLYSLLDDYVLPHEGLRFASVPKGWTEQLVPPACHIYMLYSPAPARSVVEFFRECAAQGDKQSTVPDAEQDR